MVEFSEFPLDRFLGMGGSTEQEQVGRPRVGLQQVWFQPVRFLSGLGLGLGLVTQTFGPYVSTSGQIEKASGSGRGPFFGRAPEDVEQVR
jgi:hypothetical protein